MTTANPSNGIDVWKRVWESQPSVEKDRRRLEIEAAGPRWSRIVETLETTYGSIQGLKVVELGAGRGDMSALLAMRGAEVTLLDNLPEVLDQARERFDALGLHAEYVEGDLLDIRSSVEPHYDVAVSSGVIEHFKGGNRLETVIAHRAVLKNGGMAIASVPHAHCLPYRLWKGYLELRGWWPYGMEIPYSGRELKKLARKAGFRNVQTVSTSFLESLGEHWYKHWFGRRPSWNHRPSFLDSSMGQVITLYAQAGL